MGNISSPQILHLKDLCDVRNGQFWSTGQIVGVLGTGQYVVKRKDTAQTYLKEDVAPLHTHTNNSDSTVLAKWCLQEKVLAEDPYCCIKITEDKWVLAKYEGRNKQRQFVFVIADIDWTMSYKKWRSQFAPKATVFLSKFSRVVKLGFLPFLNLDIQKDDREHMFRLFKRL